MARTPRKTTTRKSPSKAKAKATSAKDETIEDAVVLDETTPKDAASPEAKPDDDAAGSQNGPSKQGPDGAPAEQASGEDGSEAGKTDAAADTAPESDTGDSVKAAEPAEAAGPEKADEDTQDKTGAEKAGTDLSEAAASLPEDTAKDTSGDAEAKPAGDTGLPLPPAAAVQPESSGASRVIPLVFGGVLAGLIGYAVAIYTQGREEVDPGAMTPAEIASAFEAQSGRIDGLEAGHADFASADSLQAQADDLTGRIDALDQTLAGLGTRLGDINDRVETLALRPVATGIEADAFDGELAAFRTQLEEAIATAQGQISQAQIEAERISQDAFAAEQSATLRAAFAAVATAAVSGAPFDAPLAEIANLSDAEVPAALAENAAQGVATLADLQDAFPPAARAALAVTVSVDANDPVLTRFGAFLRAQTGARSLSPRDGDDADAVLSRAEAHLRDGDVTAALETLSALSQSGQDAMSDWMQSANAHQSVQASLDDFGQTLNLN
ncbi:MAG: hypothetical protein KJN93_02355 [Alphaproteobacteria bacterium]|nr:hypothetical protein [Alphaproteobacteria bacterium]NNF24172.1 hypothetical protein [Paracoccaceae bacterium]